MDATLSLLAMLLVVLAGLPGLVFGLRRILIRADAALGRSERPRPPRPNHPTRSMPGAG